MIGFIFVLLLIDVNVFFCIDEVGNIDLLYDFLLILNVKL